MPISNALMLVGISAAFVLFASVLAWGEYQTRHIGRRSRQEAAATAEVRSMKKQAESGDRQVSRPARLQDEATRA